jgi:hypothetical protein
MAPSGEARFVLPLLVLVAAGCTASPQGQGEVRGVLLDVQSTDIVYADSVVIRSDDGTQLSFRVSPEVASDREHPNTAGHLRQHMLIAEPVVVRYRDTPDGPMATQIRDATPMAR